MITRSCIVVVLLIAVSMCAMALPARYAVTDLGIGAARVINDSGQVVMMGQGGLYLWDNDARTLITTSAKSDEYAINNAGQVAFTDTTGKSYLWTQGTSVQVAPTISLTHVLGLSDSGVVVGSCGSEDARYGHAFSWQGSVTTELAASGVRSNACDVNSDGLIAGWAFLSGIRTAVTWQNGTMTPLPSVPGDPSSAAHAVNTRGQIMGYAYTSATYDFPDTVLWDNGQVRNLGAKSMMDMNDSGQILSGSSIWEDGVGWKSLKQMMDPASRFSSYIWAYGMNNNGCIVGQSDTSVDGTTHALLLTPVPEPGSLMVLGAGLVSLAGMIRRRR